MTVIFFISCQSLCNTIYASATLPIVNRITRNNLPPDLLAEAQKTKVSILKPTDANRPILYKNYPNGSVLFPKNPDVATKFNTMIKAIQQNPDVIEFFRKIYLSSLINLYTYGMKIYTNFNLINPGCDQTQNPPTADVAAYLVDDAMYATNQKKLIMNHYMNLIQNQCAGFIISCIPTMSLDAAVPFGTMFMYNDCGIDLTAFATPQIDPTIIAQQKTYFSFLRQYNDFFKTYTQYLTQADANGINQYYTMAQFIYNFLYPSATQANAPDAQDLALTKTNPTMFFYDIESMRSILFIPFIAKDLPKKSQSIPWAASIVQAAINNTSSNGHPLAYFKDIAGNKTADKNKAQSLFLLTDVGTSLFEQELLAQPGWMNTQDGIIRVLRACLGDFSAIIGMGILDETVEKILQKSAQ